MMRLSSALLCVALALVPTNAGLLDLFGAPTGSASGNTAPASAPITTEEPDTSKVVTDFVLVNAKTQKDIMLMHDGMKLDLGKVGQELTIRIETASSYTSGFVKIDLDNGSTRRVEPQAPYYLAGDENGVANAVYSILNVGPHVLVACPHDSGLFGPPDTNHATSGGRRKLEDHPDCLALRFETILGSAPAPPTPPVSADESDVPPTLPTAPTDVTPPEADIYGVVTGELKQWHTITLALSGPPASETGMTIPGAYRAPSTFADYLLDCTFTHPASGTVLIVPGYYAGDGNGANQGTIGGNTWQCKFTPSHIGLWKWSVKYAQGTNVAQNGGGNPGGFFDGAKGSLDVAASDKTGRDFRANGRLSAKGKYYQFPDGKDFIRIGSNSPSNLLDYADFDEADADAKTYASHVADYVDGQPTFANGKGKGFIGALNFLSSKGVNALTVTTLNAEAGVFPFLHSADNQLQYDLSKLDQWSVVFDHADTVGIALTFQLSHPDDDFVLNQGKLFEERKLYYREIVARFGHHLGMTWDLGSDVAASVIEERSSYIRTVDPYKSPIIFRTSSSTPLATLSGITTLDGVALTSSDMSTIAADTASWRAAGYVVISTEQGPAAVGVKPDTEDPTHDLVRADALWGHLMAGGAGVMYTFGTSFAESDVTLQDFRSRDTLWTQSKVALDFVSTTSNFSTLTPANGLVSSGNWCLSSSDTIVVYKKASIAATITVTKSYKVQWFNPRTGGAMIQGSKATVEAGTAVSLGAPASDPDADWVIVLSAL